VVMGISFPCNNCVRLRVLLLSGRMCVVLSVAVRAWLCVCCAWEGASG
jgi:hypothetical protein